MATRTFSETIKAFPETLLPGDDVFLDTALQSRTRAVAREYLTRFMNRDAVVLTDIGEVGKFVASIGNRKASGSDGFRAQVVKKVFSRKPELVVGLYNACLLRGYFPRKLKMGELRL